MRNKKTLFFLIAFAAIVSMTSCSDSESYAELLDKERHAANAYLANCRVVNEIPADTIFEVGPDAPYYRIDPEGNVYMQVIKAGDRKNDKAKDSERIYFRYMRYNLYYWHTYGEMYGDGNENDMNAAPTYFQYGNYSLTSSAQWGYGIQMPLNYLGVDSEVNLIIKSQYGWASEISNVQPYLYHVRYFRNQI
ncbi:MAG: DUF4827 family protein [Muribaculaceae bacterium]|nr:DUF4827 family protein [Muribaculaceae bacterium]